MGKVVPFQRHCAASPVTGSLKRNTERSTCLPKPARASVNSTKYSAGNSRRALQLLTADVPTPASVATAPGPPNASITSSTEFSMLLHSSRTVNMSSVHASAVESCPIVVFNLGMAESLKSLGNRLKITRQALDLSAAELCRQIACKPNRWSQYESGERKITVEVANRLCDEFGLSLDWIYRANPALLPHAIRMKIRQVA